MIDNQKLKQKVKELCADERFIHHKWYFQYHLEIIERIVDELKQYYLGANFEIVNSMIWFHDLAKIVKNQGVNAEDVLVEIGFSKDEIEFLLNLTKEMDGHREIDLNNSSVEIKIISSADGVAHLIGPFYSIYWYENPDKSMDYLLSGDLEKMKRDWERKVVLPELKNSFEERYKFRLEQRGVYPEKFIQ
jgi:hypothetical protein